MKPAAPLSPDEAGTPPTFDPDNTQTFQAKMPAAPVWFSSMVAGNSREKTRLRAEIEPVSAADFTRFLFEWQFAGAGNAVEGAASTQKILSFWQASRRRLVVGKQRFFLCESAIMRGTTSTA